MVYMPLKSNNNAIENVKISWIKKISTDTEKHYLKYH